MLRFFYLFLFYSFLLCLSLPSLAQFGEKQVIADGIVNEEFELAVDLNQDGNTDLLVFRRDQDLTYSNETRYTGSHIIKINDGNNKFTEEHVVKYDKNDWYSIKPTDLDKDGRMDLIVNSANGSAWLRNEGNYKFTWMAKVGDNDYAANGDVDNDGDLDIVNSNEIRLNDGEGVFTVDFSFFDLDVNVSGVSGVFDLDDDGKNEVLLTAENTFSVLNRQDDGTYTRTDLSIDYGSTSELEYRSIKDVVDIDKDGLLDIIYTEFTWEGASSADSQFKVLYNTGGFSFTTYNQPLIEEVTYAYRPLQSVLVDINEDGYLDIVTQRGIAYFDDNTFDVPRSKIYIHINNQDRTFSATTPLKTQRNILGKFTSGNNNKALIDANAGVELVDLQGTNPTYNLLYREELNFYYNAWDWNYISDIVQSADIDGDNFKDIIVGSARNVSWFSSENNFQANIIENYLWTPTAIDVGDVNQDEAIDIVMSSTDEHPWENKTALYVRENNTFGYDSSLHNTDFRRNVYNHLYLRDIDNDGVNDIIGGGGYSGDEDIYIYLNGGNGKFDDGTSLGAAFSGDKFLVEVADFNQDGLIDILAFENNSSLVSLYKNQGGEFAASQLLIESIELKRMEVGDIDGDGYPDLLGYKDASKDLTWYKNVDGSALEAVATYPTSDGCNDIDLIDMDADGDLDIVAALANDNQSLVWYENTDGKGAFSEAKSTSRSARVVHGDDLDGDGDTDLVIVNFGEDVTSELYWLENRTPPIDNSTLELKLEDTQGLQQDTISIPVKVGAGFTDITSLTFSLGWDVEAATYVGVSPANGFGLETSATEFGQLGITWSNEDGQSMDDGSTLFTLRLLLIGEEESINSIDFSTVPVAESVTKTAGGTVSLSTQGSQIIIEESQAPTAISLTNIVVAENQPSGTQVGSFNTTDPDNSDGFVYALVAGEGSEDNDSFSIDGRSLVTQVTFDYETTPKYSIRVRTTDSRGKSFVEVFEITVEDVDDTNNLPTNILLSASTIDENKDAQTLIGTFSTEDADTEDTHTFSLIEGEGDDDNEKFVINEESKLLSAVPFDFEEKKEYKIRVQVKDDKEGTYSKEFTIKVNDLNESSNNTPTNIALDNNSVEENQPQDTPVGSFTTTDADAGDTHVYALVAGTGDEGNAFFRVQGNRLLTATSFDFEVQTEYSIRVEAKDGKGGRFAKTFTISITNQSDVVNIAPTNITLSNNAIDENQAVGTLVGELLSEDPDNAIFTYSLVNGTGSTHNALFLIDENELRTAASFDYETLGQLSIRIQTDDGRGGSFSRSFTIQVNDVTDGANRLPTDIRLSSLTVGEDATAGALIGKFSASDPDADDAHTFRLVAGEIANDNRYFTINNDQLLTAEDFNPAMQESYIIRVQTDDGRGGTYAESFVIGVVDGSGIGPLAVANPIEDQQIAALQAFSLEIPGDVFQGTSLSLTVTLSNGSALPDWLTFDASTNTLSGTPPAGSASLTLQVTATNPQGDSVSDEFILSIDGVTAIGEEFDLTLRVYPVPAEHILLIETQESTLRLQSYRLMDTQGHILDAQTVTPRIGSTLPIDVSSLVGGVYFLELQTTEGMQQRRILVQ
ncbi:MAG: FG-GAP-like repeat-containing protein [Cyclobacteriaceae bacterium]